jgi:hypothetical protein
MLGIALDDDGIDEHEGRRIFPDVDDRDAARDPDLIGREAHAFGGTHRFQEIVDELAHGIVDGRDGRRLLPQDR